MLEQGEILRERYKVIGRLGQGGMGAVYEAHDNVFDTSVALKEVTIDLSNALDTQAQEMTKLAFEREAKILAKISHETIPHVKDYFIEEDAQFLIMELVDGDDLAKLLKQRNAPFPMGTIIEWTDQLLDALDYLHNQNPPIIHRDIKPQNLKLTSRSKIKLLDFGIAKGTESASANTVTNQTFIAATLNYSPIEQMVRVLDPTFLAVITHKYSNQIETILAQNADVRTDIFALGATLYHMATNTQPAEAVKRGIEVWDGKPDPLLNPTQINPEIPAEFSEFLLKSMQINRQHRFDSALEMRNALQTISKNISSPTLNPTIEMNQSDFKTQQMPAGSLPQTNKSPNDVTEQFNKDTNQTEETPTEIAKPKQQMPNRQKNQANQFANNPSQPKDKAKKKSNKLLWLIPIVGLILFIFVGGAVGLWLVIVNFGSSPVAIESNRNTNKKPEKTTINIERRPDDSGKNEIEINSNVNEKNEDADLLEASPSPENEPQKTPVVSSTKKPKARTKQTPVIKATRKPTRKPTKKPTRKPTRKPKNMDCIFTDSC